MNTISISLLPFGGEKNGSLAERLRFYQPLVGLQGKAKIFEINIQVMQFLQKVNEES
jgi:hypothetical protein